MDLFPLSISFSLACFLYCPKHHLLTLTNQLFLLANSGTHLQQN